MAPAGTPSHAVDLLMAMIVAEMFGDDRKAAPPPRDPGDGALDLPDIEDD